MLENDLSCKFLKNS